MSVQKTRAENLLNNPLLAELIEAYQWGMYQDFIHNTELDAETWAKGRAALDIQSWIENKCREILDANE